MTYFLSIQAPDPFSSYIKAVFIHLTWQIPGNHFPHHFFFACHNLNHIPHSSSYKRVCFAIPRPLPWTLFPFLPQSSPGSLYCRRKCFCRIYLLPSQIRSPGRQIPNKTVSCLPKSPTSASTYRFLSRFLTIFWE